jgi:hypothetical protein
MHHPTEWLKTHDMHTAIVVPIKGKVHDTLELELLEDIIPSRSIFSNYSKFEFDLQFKFSFITLSHNIL